MALRVKKDPRFVKHKVGRDTNIHYQGTRFEQLGFQLALSLGEKKGDAIGSSEYLLLIQDAGAFPARVGV